MSTILNFRASPEGDAFNDLLRMMRGKRISDRDPIGADACRRKVVKKLMKRAEADGRPDTARFLERNCHACGLCGSVAKFLRGN